MNPEAIGAFTAAFVGISGGFGALFIRLWTYMAKRERFWEAKVGILWEMIDLRDTKLDEVARAAGVSVNGSYESEKRHQQRSWEDLNRRGEA